MKALVHTAPLTFELREIDQPDPAEGEVLVRLRAVGICGSDVHGMTGTTGRRIPPVIMGHEAAGEVVRVGAGVDRQWLGKRVTFDSTISCGSCDFCRAGEVNLCDNRTVIGVSCDEYRRDGALADYIAVPERILYALPDGVTYDHGAMAEPLSVAVHAVRRTVLTETDRVLVVGCGIIGLLTIQAARAAGCGVIVATDLSERRREAATVCGADLSVPPESVSASGPVDVAFEAVGAAPTVYLAVDNVRKGGTVVLIGNVSPQVPLPLQTVVTRQLSLLGSCASAGEYDDCLAMIERGEIDLEPLITDTLSLEQAADMFHQLHQNPDEHLKAIVHPEEHDV